MFSRSKSSRKKKRFQKSTRVKNKNKDSGPETRPGELPPPPPAPPPTPKTGQKEVSERDDHDQYGHIHKIVLQGMLAAGVLNAKGVKRLFYGACTYLNLSPAERTSMSYIQKIVREINEKTMPYDFCIKSVTCEMTGVKYYMFLVSVEKPILKLQTFFSKFETELFHMCLNGILVKSNTFGVPIIEMMNYAIDTQMRGTVMDAEVFINRMIKMKYFLKMEVPGSDHVEVTLAFRGIREFEPILRELYSSTFVNCHLCKTILLHGFVCPVCRLVVHRGCYTKYMKGDEQNCPNCKSLDWTNKDKVLPRTRDVSVLEITTESDSDEEEARNKQSRMSDTSSSSGSPRSLDEIHELANRIVLLTESGDNENSNSSNDDESMPMPILERMVAEPVAGPSRLAYCTGGRPNEFPGRAALVNYSDSESDVEPELRRPDLSGVD